jgi:topoisomerase IA-like protein
VPKTADAGALTLEQAVALLKARAEAGPSKRPRARAAAGGVRRTSARVVRARTRAT